MPAKQHQHIVITGVTRGLGRALTEKLIALGHTVAGCGRSKVAVARLKSAFGKPHVFEVVNVTDDRQVKSWARRVLERNGPPDLLINNAALINTPAPLWRIAASDFNPVIDVNIKGVANVIRHFVPAMVEKGHGIVVNFSSYWGRSTAAEVAPYCATKFAIEGLTRALAQELPKGMAAVAFNPGIIDTDMLRITFGDDAGTYPSPEKWSARAVPVLLELSSKDNGKTVNVPG